MGENQTVYDDVQLALGVAGGAAMLIGETNPGVSGRAASPQKCQSNAFYSKLIYTTFEY